MTEVFDTTRFRPYIAAALRHAGDTHSVSDVEAMIAAGRAQLWPGPESVVITELIAYPNRTDLHCWLAGGNRHELAAMTPLIMEWGKSQGCSKGTLTGRLGWLRMPFLRDLGFTQEHVTLERDL